MDKYQGRGRCLSISRACRLDSGNRKLREILQPPVSSYVFLFFACNPVLNVIIFDLLESTVEIQMCLKDEHGGEKCRKQKAVPEVLLKVVEAKRLLESSKAITVQDATERVGISRSSFYKYKDDIFPFHDNSKGKSITFILQMDDEPGLLSLVLQTIAEYKGNVLTIHQTIPINGVASLTLTVDLLPITRDVSSMIEQIEGQPGIHYLKILAKE